jgi:hypothetical protein
VCRDRIGPSSVVKLMPSVKDFVGACEKCAFVLRFLRQTSMKMAVCWDVVPYSPVDINCRFRLHLVV